VDNDLHDDEDGSNGKDDWILGKPFGKAEKKHSDDR
jgi:hypothetical protein